METNELPEEAKLKILMEVVEKANKRWMYSQPDDLAEAAEFGYRLALQSKEEELEGLKDEIETAREWMKVHEGENSKYLQIQEQLKAKDEQIKGLINRRVGHTVLDGLYEEQKATIDSLTSAVEAVRSVVNLEPKMDGVLLGSCDRKKAGNALHNLFSLLSQSTDKP